MVGVSAYKGGIKKGDAMSRASGVVVALILGVLVLPSCTGVSIQNAVAMVLSASPTDPETNQDVSFTLAANASQIIVQSRIDFETDGVWDDTRVHSTMDVADIFIHSYPSTGSRNVTAEITLADQTSESRATTVNVVLARLLVEYTLRADDIFGTGTCAATGPPYAPPGVFLTLPQFNVETQREPVGLFDSGSTVSMAQQFGPNGMVSFAECDFFIKLYVGQSIIGEGTCFAVNNTTCIVIVQGTVP